MLTLISLLFSKNVKSVLKIKIKMALPPRGTVVGACRRGAGRQGLGTVPCGPAARGALLPPYPLQQGLNAVGHSSGDDTVTEPPKIILYYRLRRSTWPLSNNKELFCRLCRGMPAKSLTTGSRYVLSPHEGGTRVHHFIT
jgi:hypothetical protein